MVEGASLGCCGSGSGESVPFAGGSEACAEPETLERRDVSFVMSRFLTAGLGGLVLLAGSASRKTVVREALGTRLSTDGDRASTHQIEGRLWIR
jgi:hypothetical protein